MPTSYTSLLGLALPVTGELAGTWGDTVNDYITSYLDASVAGTQTISGSQTAVTLSVTNGSSLVTAGSGATGSAQFQIINCTGNPAGLLTITAPASSRQYIIINGTSTSQSVKIVGAGPTTGVTLVAGEKAHVAWNGSDFVKIATQSGNGSFVDLTVSGNLTLSGGTANGVLYLNASKVATSGSALTFNGTTLATTGALTVDGNTTLGNASTDTVQVNGYMGVGGAGNSQFAVSALSTALTGGDQRAFRAGITATSSATTRVVGVSSSLSTAAASFTVGDMAGFYAFDNVKGAGSTITNQHGLYIADQTQGTNNYGIRSAVSSGTNKWNIYASGTAANYFAGNVLIGTTTSNAAFAGKLQYEGTAADFSMVRYVAASGGPNIYLAHSRGAAVGTNTIVNSGDALGSIIFSGANGTGYSDAAYIQGAVDGTPGASADMPGRLVFATSSDGSATPTERLRLSSTEAVFNDPGNDYDFRVESDTNTHALFVDAGNSRIGVNNSTPTVALDVTGDIKSSGTVSSSIVIADYIYASNIANVGSFTWNTATSSPAAVINRGSQVITPIHTGMRRCVINDSGVVQYYLSATDSTKKADGTNANIDGTDGQVMVEIPKFYTRREVSGTYITWSISPVPLPGFTLHPAFDKDGSEVDFRYYGAYDACVYDDSAAAYISGLNYDNNVSPNGVAVDTAADKLASVSGIYPMVGLTRAECRTIAANRGTGWRQLDFTLWSAVQLLYLIEYQSFYSQNILGAGNTGTTYAASSGTQSDNGGSEAGKSNGIGNASTNTTNGASSASRGVAWMSYRGIENFYGNEWNWVDGVIVNAAGAVGANAAVWDYTNNSADFSDTVNTNMTQITTSGVTTSNYASAIASVDDFFIATSVSGGSSSTYTTDYWYGSASADRVVIVGGSATEGANAGAFGVSAGNGASVRSRAVGARLCW